LKAINQGKIKKLVVIVVNARSDPPSPLDTDAGSPGIVDMFKTVTSVAIDSATATLDLQLQSSLVEIAKAAREIKPASAQFAGMRVYGVLVDFDQLPASTDEERRLRDQVKSVPTSWTLTAEQLKLVESVGGLLLRRDPCFRWLLEDLGAPTTTPTDAGVPTNSCITRTGS